MFLLNVCASLGRVLSSSVQTCKNIKQKKIIMIIRIIARTRESKLTVRRNKENVLTA